VVERYEDALAEADGVDERIDAGEPDPPPLLGVPCTIKESFAVAGMPNTGGLLSRRGRTAERTAPAAQRLLDSGAILLGLTNLSELTMWIESDNRLYGRTLNAYDRRRTAGGSSGGEGAAVGCGGSPIGLGTDFAGSIRLPAFFNGVFGHKSSRGLVPLTGHFPISEGEAMRMSVPGPFARRAEDLMPVLRLIAGPDGEDRIAAAEIELGDPDAVEVEGLDVVISERASYLPVSRELREARERAAGALAGAGAKLRREDLRSVRRAAELFLAAAQEGAGISLAELIVAEGGEPVSFTTAFRRDNPHTLATLLTIAAERAGELVPRRRIRKARAAAESLERELEGAIGDGVMLHPPHPRVAPRHGWTVGRPWLLAPTALFNLLGMPATQVPLGLGRKGLPLGVQVAAAHGNDHVAIAAAIELERALGGWVPPPSGSERARRASGTRSSARPRAGRRRSSLPSPRFAGAPWHRSGPSRFPRCR
jgi:Asp-tRNA(Asn)/Glu-tRNA(Gln) amidotransferase A subunit family amidase